MAQSVSPFTDQNLQRSILARSLNTPPMVPGRAAVTSNTNSVSNGTTVQQRKTPPIVTQDVNGVNVERMSPSGLRNLISSRNLQQTTNTSAQDSLRSTAVAVMNRTSAASHTTPENAQTVSSDSYLLSGFFIFEVCAGLKSNPSTRPLRSMAESGTFSW